jgi:hypothetical protein
VDALRCASELQAGMAERNTEIAADQRIEFRIGINVGDVVVEDGDIFGDGVNVAARLEGLADPGGICVSALAEGCRSKLDIAFEDLCPSARAVDAAGRPRPFARGLAQGRMGALTLLAAAGVGGRATLRPALDCHGSGQDRCSWNQTQRPVCSIKTH